MSSTAKISILSGTIHSGKSTALSQFCGRQKNCAGIICPDIDGLRMILDVARNIIHPFQKAQHTSEDDILIGKYIFSAEGFDLANQILKDSASLPDIKTIIVDEIGKLELEKKGIYRGFDYLLQLYQTSALQAELLIVVRDYLLQDVITFFNLKDPDIFSIEQLNQRS